MKALEGQPIWVCGGAAVYKLLLPFCHTFWVTHVHQKPEGDTYLPQWQPPFEPQEVVHTQAEFTLVRYTQAAPAALAGFSPFPSHL
jgi:dihydrofolate reductase